MSTEIKDIENVVIVGSGPAGYTAALYTSRADLDPLMIEGFAWGGLLQQTTDVENYPGYPEGVLGPEMMQDFRNQAERFGTRFITDDATKLELASEPGGVHRVWIGEREIRARSVILSMGAEPKKLGVPGEDELAARGVSYCATCDASFFRNHDAIVVGGGDTAMEDATFLAKFADKVVIVHRRDDFRASAIMLDRARDTDNIELLTPYVVRSFEPGDNGSLAKVVLESKKDGSTHELAVTGAFIAIGHRPNSQLVEGQLKLDDEGYVLVESRSTKTELPGVFAAGDLTDRVYRQAVTAAGTGCMAALDAEAYLRDTPVIAEAHWAAPAAAAPPSTAPTTAVEAAARPAAS
jgi:thioredoxin reductase (NADPH)